MSNVDLILLVFDICSYIDHTSRNNNYNTDRIKFTHWIFKTDEILVKVKLVKIYMTRKGVKYYRSHCGDNHVFHRDYHVIDRDLLFSFLTF